jgi:hypothetical protein
MPNFIKQGDYLSDPSGSGFTIPDLGGPIAARFGSLLWTDPIGTLFQLPQGAQIVDWTTIVSEAFGGGTASARIGDPTTNNRWATTIDIGTAGLSKTGYVGSAVLTPGTLTSDTYVLATLNAPGTATAGTLQVLCSYMMR